MIEQSLNTISAGGQNWGETCMRPGNYVVLLTGCWYTTEDVFPKIQLIEEPGEFDPRKYLSPGRTAIEEIVQNKIKNVFGCSGSALK